MGWLAARTCWPEGRREGVPGEALEVGGGAEVGGGGGDSEP